MHVCHGCRRHVRETRCPFCGAVAKRPSPERAIPRFAIVAGALSVGACQDSSQTSAAPHVSARPTNVADAAPRASVGLGPLPPGATVAVYGIPPPPPHVVAPVAVDASDPNAMVEAYGVPPPHLVDGGCFRHTHAFANANDTHRKPRQPGTCVRRAAPTPDFRMSRSTALEGCTPFERTGGDWR